MQIKISPTDQFAVEELRKRQDYHAFSLGVLVASYLQKRAAILKQDSPNMEQLGTLEFERIRHETFWEGKIAETEVLQQIAGETAIRHAGLDPGKGDYIIIDSIIMQLVNGGAYVPLER